MENHQIVLNVEDRKHFLDAFWAVEQHSNWSHDNRKQQLFCTGKYDILLNISFQSQIIRSGFKLESLILKTINFF